MEEEANLKKEKKPLERYQEIERGIITTYRKEIWSKFVKGVQEFSLVNDGDKIAVCISGGKDSMLMAKCMQELKRHRKVNFDLEFIVMDPGYNAINREKIISNAKLLNIPIQIFETPIFNSVDRIDDNPCYICARMRRGYLYEKAKSLGCNKIALGHHMDDVIETVLMGMFYGAQFQTMMPKIRSTSHKGMELIRPMYYIKEEDIIRWKNKNNLEFIMCACHFTEAYTKNHNEDLMSKRKEMKDLIANLRKVYSNIDMNILRSTENVNLDTVISYRQGNSFHSFLDDYEEKLKQMKELGE